MAMSGSASSGRMPGTALVAWAKAKWDGTNWTLVSGSGLTISGTTGTGCAASFVVAQPDANYVVDVVANTYGANASWATAWSKSTGAFTVGVQGAGSGISAVAGDVWYFGVYR